MDMPVQIESSTLLNLINNKSIPEKYFMYHLKVCIQFESFTAIQILCPSLRVFTFHMRKTHRKLIAFLFNLSLSPKARNAVTYSVKLETSTILFSVFVAEFCKIVVSQG